MIEKTSGIVLHTLKYSDSGSICHIFTREFGRLPFFIRLSRGKKASGKNVYYQPLQMLEIEFYNKVNRDIQNIKEVSTSYIFNSIPYNAISNSIALFIAEILYRSIPEKEADKTLYQYIADSIIHLDKSKGNLSNFHLGFLVGYASYLGISPQSGLAREKGYFDMQNGIFTKNIPLHGYYFDSSQTDIFYLFLTSSIAKCEEIKLSGKIRNQFLNNILTYFSLHLPGIKNIKSLDVLTQLFS